jgi:protein TonB
MAEAVLKSRFPAKSKALPKQNLIQKNRRSKNKPTMAKPLLKQRKAKENKLITAETLLKDRVKRVEELPVGQEQEMRDEQTENVLPARIASIPAGTTEGPRKVSRTAQEGGSGQDIVTYAEPKYKENPPPHYPRVARRRGYEGRTLLRVEVLENGKVGRIEIAASSGFKSLDQAALESVEDWTFVPGTRNGKKTTQRVVVPIRFSLE